MRFLHTLRLVEMTDSLSFQALTLSFQASLCHSKHSLCHSERSRGISEDCQNIRLFYDEVLLAIHGNLCSRVFAVKDGFTNLDFHGFVL